MGRISLLGRPRTGSEEGTAMHPGLGMQAMALSGPAGIHLPQCPWQTPTRAGPPSPRLQASPPLFLRLAQ